MCQHPADVTECFEGRLREMLCKDCKRIGEDTDVQEFTYIPLEERGYCEKCLKVARRFEEEFEP